MNGAGGDDGLYSTTAAHTKSSPFVIDPAYHTVKATSPSSSCSCSWWLYGEAELECYRLAVLRGKVTKAQLNVWYPGNFHTPSRRALFRIPIYEPRTQEKELVFRTNGTHIVARVGECVVYESDSGSDVSASVNQNHRVMLNQDAIVHGDYLVIDVVTLLQSTEEACAEPPCLCIVRDNNESEDGKSLSKWQWSPNGINWGKMRAFPLHALDAPYPHLLHDTAVGQSVFPVTTAAESNIYDFGTELLGRIVVEASSKPVLYVGESLNEVQNNDSDHFEQSTELEAVKDGVWQSAHFLALRYVRLLEEAACTSSVYCHAQSYPVTYRGAFYSSRNEVETRIWCTAAYTLRLCMHDFFLVDGIKRDRLPWAGDLAVSIMANAYAFGQADIVRQTLTVLGRGGMHINGCVDYSLWWIICQDLYQMYFHDSTHLDLEWTRIKNTLSSLLEFCHETTGLLEVNEKDWVFIDWVKGMEKTTSMQILWWWALKCGIALGLRTKDTEMVVMLQQHQAHVKDSLHCLYWDAKASLWMTTKTTTTPCAPDAQEQQQYSRHANLLAIVSGLTPTPCESIRDALRGSSLAPVGTPYMKFFECRALCLAGEEATALNSVRVYWGGMLKKGATTFWEAFDEKETDCYSFYNRPYGKSLCHAWGAGPCQLLPEAILGIRPLADGWTEWTCGPFLPDHPMVGTCATVPTPHGNIEVDVTAPESIRIVVPSGTVLKTNGESYKGPNTVFLSTDNSQSEAQEKNLDSKTIKAWSAPYRGWHYHSSHVIPPEPQIHGFEDVTMTDVPTVYQIPGDAQTWRMSFIGYDGKGYQTFVAESDNLLHWTNMRLAMGYGEEGEFDFGGRVLGAYLFENYDIKAPRVLKLRNDAFWSLYGSYAKQGDYEIDPGYEGVACSKDGVSWQRTKREPILSVHDDDVGEWERSSIYQPWLVEHDGKFYNFYNAKTMTPAWTEQIGLSTSNDLLRWQRHATNPVLCVRPDGFDTLFCADAKVFRDGDHWTMFYFGVNKDESEAFHAHIMVAFSYDLVHWTADTEPLYRAGGHPFGVDNEHAHKISLVWNPVNDTWYMFYCAVGNKGRGIGLLSSKPL